MPGEAGRRPAGLGARSCVLPRHARVGARRDRVGFRALARRLLTAGGFKVVGEAADGHGAVAAARELRPDVVLLDVQLPGMDGFQVAERLGDGEADPVGGEPLRGTGAGARVGPRPAPRGA